MAMASPRRQEGEGQDCVAIVTESYSGGERLGGFEVND